DITSDAGKEKVRVESPWNADGGDPSRRPHQTLEVDRSLREEVAKTDLPCEELPPLLRCIAQRQAQPDSGFLEKLACRGDAHRVHDRTVAELMVVVIDRTPRENRGGGNEGGVPLAGNQEEF